MKILITGCAGFIGFHLTRQLLNFNYEVTGIDNINDYYDVDLKYDRLAELGIERKSVMANRCLKSQKYTGLEFYKIDLTAQDEIFTLFNEKRFDWVCHLAAQAGVRYSITDPQAYIGANLQGFFNVLEASRKFKIKHLFYASSSSVYGLNTNMPFSTIDNTDQPASLYAATKKCNELMAHSYSHLFDLGTTGMRFFTVYGPWGRPDMALFLFTKAIVEGKPIQVFNQGQMKRDFTYVDDIVNGIMKIINKVAYKSVMKENKQQGKPPYHIYNIGKGLSIALSEFIYEIEKNLGTIAKKEYLPMQDGDIEMTWSDITAMKKDFEYQPCTGIAEGVKNFVDWYTMYYAQKKQLVHS
jgi:UDP-glucuronate 4-epimerase